MKILYLHQYFVFPEDSGGTRSYDLATSFVQKGYAVEIVTSSSFIKNYKFTKRWNKIERNGLNIHVLKLNYNNELSYIKRSLVFFQFLWFATFKMIAIETDVVLATSTPLTIGIPALIKKWIQKTPFIFEARDVWPEAVIALGAVKNKTLQRLLYRLEKLIYNNASAIVPLSVDMKNSIVSRYPKLINKPIEVIENISEINRFQIGLDFKASIINEKIGFNSRFSILYAGTFGRVNGIDYVIKLAEKLLSIDGSIVFLLVGTGAKKDNVLKEAIERKVLNKNVFIWDSVSKDELPQLYHETSMGSSFVTNIKELWANSANKFFDTLAAGRPILINHSGWQKEVIESENIGYVLPATLKDEDIINFLKYTKNENLIRTQQINALKIAKDKYSLEKAVEKYLTLFNEINVKHRKN